MIPSGEGLSFPPLEYTHMNSILLEDGTIGLLDSLPEVGDVVTVKLLTANGLHIEKTGRVESILYDLIDFEV